MKVLGPLRLGLEIVLLVALAVIGASAAWWAAILIPLAVAMVWGRWVAPNARQRLADPARLLLELALYIGTGAALATIGRTAAAVTLTAASITVAIGLRAFEGDRLRSPEADAAPTTQPRRG